MEESEKTQPTQEFHIGQKIWIEHGLKIQEAEILDLPQKNLILYRIPFDAPKLSLIAKIFGYWYSRTETKEEFIKRIIK